jgi:hypothetical protein
MTMKKYMNTITGYFSHMKEEIAFLLFIILLHIIGVRKPYVYLYFTCMLNHTKIFRKYVN